VFTDRRQQRQPNHNTNTYYVYWRTTTTINPIGWCLVYLDICQPQGSCWFHWWTKNILVFKKDWFDLFIGWITFCVCVQLMWMMSLSMPRSAKWVLQKKV
jgi:hypothetical protein